MLNEAARTVYYYWLDPGLSEADEAKKGALSKAERQIATCQETLWETPMVFIKKWLSHLFL